MPAVLCIVIGVLPTIAIQMIEPVNRLVAGEGLLDGGHGGWVWLAPAKRVRQQLQRSHDVPDHHDPDHPGGLHDPPLRVQPGAAVDRLGLRLHRSRSPRAVFRRQLFPAAEAGLRRPSVPHPRPGRYAGSGGKRARPLHLELRDPAWDWMFTPITRLVGWIADRVDALQFLTIRSYLSLMFFALIVLLVHGGGVAMMVVQALAGACLPGHPDGAGADAGAGLTGLVRVVKARLVGRRGPPLVQPYLDLLRLLKKEVVLAENASWLFRTTPYLVFTAIWLAAALVPTFSTALVTATADLIALVALLASARFLPGACRDGCRDQLRRAGSSREMMIAALAEPAMLMVIFSVAILVRTTSLSLIVDFMLSGDVGLRVPLALALISLLMVAIAENGRVPIDNRPPPGTHHGPRSHGAGIFRPASGADRSGQHAEAGALHGPDRLHLPALGISGTDEGPVDLLIGLVTFVLKLAGGAVLLVFETGIAKMRVFRYGEFLGGALLLSLLGAIFLYVSTGL